MGWSAQLTLALGFHDALLEAIFESSEKQYYFSLHDLKWRFADLEALLLCFVVLY